MSLLYNIYIIILSICLLINVIVSINKKTINYIRTFVIFLSVTVIIEILANWLISHGKTTISLYNFYSSFECCFYLWVLRNILRGRILKKAITICFFIYPILTLIDIYLIQRPGNFHTISYALGCLLLIFFSIAYFYELFTKPQATRLSKEPAFWISSGLLFFYSVSFPLFVSANLIRSFPRILYQNTDNILFVLNVLLYLLFSIAFLCKIQIRKS